MPEAKMPEREERSNYCFFGYGDIAERVVRLVPQHEGSGACISAFSRSAESQANSKDGVTFYQFDLDSEQVDGALAVGASHVASSTLIYTIPPKNEGTSDLRSGKLLELLTSAALIPQRVVLISTTGVYGDCDGGWVTEQSRTQPSTDRGKRRMDSEQRWTTFCSTYAIPLFILRVAGIYSNSRLPRKRLQQGVPVVRAADCGFSNRIHADDLARAVFAAANKESPAGIYNITDGKPGSISEYLQASAKQLGLPPLPEISMREAESQLSEGMLSYLNESRRIDNRKMIEVLKVAPLYPDFRIGLRH